MFDVRPWLACLLMLYGPVAAAGPALPRPVGALVLDEAELLSREEAAELRERMRRTEDERGVRLAVVTLRNTDGESPKSIAVRALNQWQVGRRSVLLLVSMQPRELYIQPGTELASRFDDEWSSDTCRTVIAPRMRENRRGAALLAGLDAIASRLVPSRAWMGWPAGGAGLLALIFTIVRLSRSRCPRCRARARRKGRETLRQATTTSTGEQRIDWACPSCQHTFSETRTLAMISTSSDSSWDSSSSSSSSDSSGSSSDGSGGGGSSW
jgi:uncharacterized membrane protein YgcG